MQEHGKQAQDDEITQLRHDLRAVRAELWSYWKAWHDEHCTEDWPHTRDSSCPYSPPPEVFYFWHAPATDLAGSVAGSSVA